MKSVLKASARILLHRMKGLAAIRHLNRSGVRILMYHNFRTIYVGEFEKQCRYLRKHYTPVSMTHVHEWLHHGRSMPPNAVVITVDDGYLDFYINAFPILKAYNFPCTVYLFTDFLDRLTWPWWDEVLFFCESAAVPAIVGPNHRVWPLRSASERQFAADQITDGLKHLPNSERLSYLAHLRETLGPLPSSPPESHAPMTWEQVRALAREGIEFGAHTKTHPILSRVDSQAELREEVRFSKRRIEEEVGTPIHFCYPNGRPESIPENGSLILREHGFLTGVTAITGLNRRESDPFLLNRVPCDPQMPFFYFEEGLAGLHRESDNGMATPAM
jgi:peptidoglycan/xylan/chitin deacetylase (PgdA/CDA1 family)